MIHKLITILFPVRFLKYMFFNSTSKLIPLFKKNIRFAHIEHKVIKPKRKKTYSKYSFVCFLYEVVRKVCCHLMCKPYLRKFCKELLVACTGFGKLKRSILLMSNSSYGPSPSCFSCHYIAKKGICWMFLMLCCYESMKGREEEFQATTYCLLLLVYSDWLKLNGFGWQDKDADMNHRIALWGHFNCSQSNIIE